MGVEMKIDRRSFLKGVAGAAASLSLVSVAPGIMFDDEPSENMLFRAVFMSSKDGSVITEYMLHRVYMPNDKMFSFVDKEKPIFEIEVKEDMTFVCLQGKVPQRFLSETSQEWMGVEFSNKTLYPTPRYFYTGDLVAIRITKTQATA